MLTRRAMKLEIPKALRLREERISSAPRQAVDMGGATGERRVAGSDSLGRADEADRDRSRG